MNKATLLGRLTRDPELKHTQSGTAVCSFTIAIDRRFQKPGEEKQADFINCVAWEKRADLIAEHFHKGSRILAVGSIQTRKYDDKNGNKVTATEVVVDEIEFIDPKKEAAPAVTPAPPTDFLGDGELPFDL
jgi:single-strand DNA-binding protein